ncbi:hypothetical protein QA612_03625 [Evansella sp. AB-P1]|uniref:hypothetical protein n=1 Tax=Evansella sp. AB-P1 TaxID=3037653 RepID=UPI00241CBE56|nr:hypothetical protein [Evansella sp. AB-P1]MDG5786568.1 hypothetical protein [Evansella sp. AB-P1]
MKPSLFLQTMEKRKCGKIEAAKCSRKWRKRRFAGREYTLERDFHPPWCKPSLASAVYPENRNG